MPLKLAMLGMWHPHAAGIVKQVAAHPDEFSLVGFWDSDPKLAASRQEPWSKLLGGPIKVCERPDEVLKLDLDGVIVEGRVFENVALARQALEAGFPVMLEKPAGTNLRDFQALVDLAQKKHLRVQMIYLFRYMSGVLEMLKRGKAGDYGRIYEFRARLPKPIAEYDLFVSDLGRYSGGIFFEMAGHMVDIMVSLLGRPQKITPFLAHHHASPGKFVDNGIAIFQFEHAFGVLEVPALEVAPHSRRFEVYGTSGACVIPHLGSGHVSNKSVQPVEVFTKGMKDWQTLEPEAATLQIADLREFAATLAGKKEPDYSLEHDLIVHEALLSASGMLES